MSETVACESAISICWFELYSYLISRVNMNQLAKETFCGAGFTTGETNLDFVL